MFPFNRSKINFYNGIYTVRAQKIHFTNGYQVSSIFQILFWSLGIEKCADPASTCPQESYILEKYLKLKTIISSSFLYL